MLKSRNYGPFFTERMEEQERRLMMTDLDESKEEKMEAAIVCPVVDLNAGRRGPAEIVPVEHETRYGQLLPTGPGSTIPKTENPPACHICK